MAEVGAIAAIAGTAYTIYAGEESRRRQKGALKDQRKAQDDAKRKALAEQRRQEQERRRLNRKSPIRESLLLAEEQAKLGEPGGTSMLTDRSGAGANLEPFGERLGQFSESRPAWRNRRGTQNTNPDRSTQLGVR